MGVPMDVIVRRFTSAVFSGEASSLQVGTGEGTVEV